MDVVGILEARGIPEERFRRVLGVSGETLRLWKLGQRRMGIETVKRAEAKFGIPRHLLRPDVWEPPAPVTSPARSKRRAA